MELAKSVFDFLELEEYDFGVVDILLHLKKNTYNLLVFFLSICILLSLPTMSDDIKPLIQGFERAVLLVPAHRETNF